MESFRGLERIEPQTADSHYIRNMDKTSLNYFKMEDVSSGPLGLTDHTATNGIMIKESRGWYKRCFKGYK